MIPDKATLTIYKFNSEAVIKHLTDEQAGRLFKAILVYGNDGKITDLSDDAVLSMMFDLYRKGIDELDEKYRVQRQKKRDAGHKGGIKKSSEAKRSETKQSEAKQSEAVLSSAKQSEAVLSEAKQSETVLSKRSIYVDVDVDADVDVYADVDVNAKTDKNIILDNNIIPETFEKIWEVYPVKEGKERASRAYIDRIREGWEPEQLLNAAIHYSEQTKKNETNKKYIIRPWNFYGSDKPFTDYIEEVKDIEYNDTGKNTIPDGFWA